MKRLVFAVGIALTLAACEKEPAPRVERQVLLQSSPKVQCPLKAGITESPAKWCIDQLLTECNQPISCPLLSGTIETTPHLCIKQLLGERDKPAADQPQPDKNTEDPKPGVPTTKEPSKDDRKLAECMPDPDESPLSKKYKEGTMTGVNPISPEAVKQALLEAGDAMHDCAPTLAQYGSSPTEMRAKDFPTSTADPTAARALSLVLVTNYMRALLAAAEIKKIPSPGFFCYGECSLRGRQHLVDDLVGELDLSIWLPDKLRRGLTFEYLLKLRKRGMHEFYQSWSLTKPEAEDGLKDTLHGYLCEEIRAKRAGGLSLSEIGALACPTEDTP